MIDKSVIKYKNRYIHVYDNSCHCHIGLEKNLGYIDKIEGAGFELERYQEILRMFGAKYESSYFENIEQCKKAIDYLVKLENEEILEEVKVCLN